MTVKALVASPAVEAPYEGALNQITWLEEAQPEFPLVDLLVEGVACQCGADVEHVFGQCPALGDDPIRRLHRLHPGSNVSISIANALRIKTLKAVNSRTFLPKRAHR